jgi:choline dehydrogenase-like flavoprotein
VADRSVLVVGSGPSGVHFALTALERGFEVTLVDGGREGHPPVHPEAGLEELKEQLDDPVAWFIGNELEGLVLPTHEQEYYGFPPSKRHVFAPAADFGYRSDGFEPLFSFARGGMSEVWTAGCYPFNAEELAAFPFPYEELQEAYALVSQRIGITGEVDDLARFMPVHDHLLPPLRLDPHSAALLASYERQRRRINSRFRAWVGRTRVATLSRSLGVRGECRYLARCLWGCPHGALYTPSETLKELEKRPGFRYLPGFDARYFRIGTDGHVTALVVRPLEGGSLAELPVERLALAAGTLGSAALVLRSVRLATGEDVTLRGLMDNRQALVPFVNLGRLGQPLPERSYQYHLLGMGLENGSPAAYVHCQITTLKTALLHPIVQSVPLDLRTALHITRNTRAALGVVNVNFHDWRREENTVSLAPGPGAEAILSISYHPPERESRRLNPVLRRVRQVLRRLGCIVPPGMSHLRPMGASAHYAGVFPMTAGPGRWTTTPDGQSREIVNLYHADGATFPFLPAKNLTFTLMANATRIATHLP